MLLLQLAQIAAHRRSLRQLDSQMKMSHINLQKIASRRGQHKVLVYDEWASGCQMSCSRMRRHRIGAEVNRAILLSQCGTGACEVVDSGNESIGDVASSYGSRPVPCVGARDGLCWHSRHLNQHNTRLSLTDAVALALALALDFALLLHIAFSFALALALALTLAHALAFAFAFAFVFTLALAFTFILSFAHALTLDLAFNFVSNINLALALAHALAFAFAFVFTLALAFTFIPSFAHALTLDLTFNFASN
ncbi:unnamed protein product [Protopolystoma xenopodis]|uniref:Uncharacterized protein n=1 Tax=Protopolystoma xenopodis TaxID=117903 RepID=A0A448X1Z9_9PLAT|nr:unnamed protein product [Protopolystoma xenopodis]